MVGSQVLSSEIKKIEVFTENFRNNVESFFLASESELITYLFNINI